MPWKVFEEDGRYCVHKLNEDGSKGETVACHDSDEMAKRQLAALYANEPEGRNLTQRLDAGLPETRSMEFSDFEVRDDGWGFEGLASPYDQVADLGAWTEEFRRGAYRRPLANGDNVRLVYDHSPMHVPVLATTGAKTMQVRDDAKGLVVRAQIAKHYVGEAARELVKRGDIKGMSPGFVVGKGNSTVEWRGKKPHRIITSLKKFFEVSLTPDPAYAGTTAEIRALRAMADSLDMAQQFLSGAYPQLEDGVPVQDAGTSEPEATADKCEKCGEEPCVCESEHEEQRSGVDTAKAEAAARRRRLQMLGFSLPKSNP